VVLSSMSLVVGRGLYSMPIDKNEWQKREDVERTLRIEIAIKVANVQQRSSEE
jgi:hypothetical protein